MSVEVGGVPADRLLEPNEVAALLAVEASWVYAAAKNGRLPCVRVGRYVRFRPEDITDYIARGGPA